jgi:hypothetical protein
MSGLALLNLLMLDLPVVVLIEKPENLSQVFGLLLEELREDVELGPLDLIILVQIESLKKLLLDLLTVEVLQVLRVSGTLDISGALLHHLQNCIGCALPSLGSESSLRSALLPYSLNSLANFFPSYSGQALNSFISLAVMIPSSSLSMILRKDLLKF